MKRIIVRPYKEQWAVSEGWNIGVEIGDEYLAAGEDVVSPRTFLRGVLEGWEASGEMDRRVGEGLRRLAGPNKDEEERLRRKLYRSIEKGFLWYVAEKQTHDIRRWCPDAKTVESRWIPGLEVDVCTHSWCILRPCDLEAAMEFVKIHRNKYSEVQYKDLTPVYASEPFFAIREDETDPVNDRHVSYWGFSKDRYGLIWDVSYEIVSDNMAVFALKEVLLEKYRR